MGSEKKKVKMKQLIKLGNNLLDTGKYNIALDNYNEALKISEEIGDVEGKSMALSNIGTVYSSWGKYEDALNYYQQTLQIFQEIGNVQGKSGALNNIGNICRSWGKYEDAINYFQQALQIFQEIGNVQGKSMALNNIGTVYGSWGKYEDALNYFQQALQIFQEIGNVQGKSMALTNIGVVYSSWGKYKDALNYYQQALLICEEVGDVQGKSRALTNIGVVYSSWGKYKDALNYYQQALQICEEVGDVKGKSIILNNIGSVERENQDLAKALYNHKEALKIARELNATHDIAEFLRELGKDYIEKGKNNKALKNIQESIEAYRSILVETPLEHKQAFESEFKHLYDLVGDLDDLLDESSTIEPSLSSSLHADIKEIIQFIRQKGMEETKILPKLDSIDQKLDKIEKRAEFTGKFLVETMGSLKIPVPIFIEPAEGGGIVSTIKAYFKGKYQDIHFVCAHCGRIHVSKLKQPGKFLSHLSKIARMFSIAGYVIPWTSGISNIITQAAGKNQKITDLFSELSNLSGKFKSPKIQEPQEIELSKELRKITDKPLSIAERENFWDHLENFDMMLCEEGCLKYICSDHQGESCPYLM